MKKKDILYLVLFGIIFVGIIGLLMAWNDGYLDNSIMDRILSIIFPAALASIAILLIIVNWFDGKIQSIMVPWLISFLLCVIYMLLPRPSHLDVIVTIILSSLLLITVIVKKWIK